MDDDFNSAKVLANLFEMAPVINSIKDHLIPADSIQASTLLLMKEKWKTFLEDIFGLQGMEEGKSELFQSVMQLLIEIRKESKTKKDFATSDNIRKQLAEMGILLKDEKDGSTSWNLD